MVNPDEGAESALDGKAIARLPEVADAARGNAYPTLNVHGRTPADIFGTMAMASDGHSVAALGPPDTKPRSISVVSAPSRWPIRSAKMPA